jgi:hypothetical protein
MDYAKCVLCKEKDHTGNMIRACKCDQWTHRDCLNKKRVSDAKSFSSCPVCGSDYNMEKHEIAEWRKIAEIIGSVLIDLCGFVLAFVAGSLVLGEFLIFCGAETTLKPPIFGALVIFGVLGFIALVYGLSQMAHGGIWFPMHMDVGRNDGALVMLIVIGAIGVVAAAIYWTVVTVKERIEKHKRSVGVREFVVRDYTRGVSDI